MRGRKQGQRGSVVEKAGAYYAVFRDRHKKQQWIGERPGEGFQTYASARRRLNELLAEVEHGTYIKPKTGKFAKFAEEWIAGRLSIEGGTDSSYASIIRCHLIPAFGELEVSEIDFPRVQAFATNLSRKKSPKTGGMLTPKTIHNVMTLLNTMMGGKFGASAIKGGYVRQNPATGVERPKKSGREVTPPTPEQVALLAATAQEIGGIGYPAVLTGVSTGVRRGELLALRYSDIDWFNEELVVRRAVKRAKATDGAHKWKWIIHTPKSAKSRRRIGLTKTALSLFSGLKEVNGAGDDDLIFPKGLVGLEPADAFIDPDYFYAIVLAPIADKAGLSRMRFHDLRHFFASMLIAQGESAKYVQDQMGHSSIQITFDTYGHLFPQARRDASRKLDRGLAEVLASNQPLGSKSRGLVEPKEPSRGILLEDLLEGRASRAVKKPVTN